jgi:hypothetical protein
MKEDYGSQVCDDQQYMTASINVPGGVCRNARVVWFGLRERRVSKDYIVVPPTELGLQAFMQARNVTCCRSSDAHTAFDPRGLGNDVSNTVS